MKTPTGLLTFGLGLVAVFGAVLGIGRLAGSVTAGSAARREARL